MKGLDYLGCVSSAPTRRSSAGPAPATRPPCCSTRPPRTGWAEIVALGGRLGGRVSLVPEDGERRARMFGLRTRSSARGAWAGTCASCSRTPASRPTGAQGGRSRWRSTWRPATATRRSARRRPVRAPSRRCASSTPCSPRAAAAVTPTSSAAPTALDLHAAVAPGTIWPLPEAECPMPAPVRHAFETLDHEVKEAVSPALLDTPRADVQPPPGAAGSILSAARVSTCERGGDLGVRRPAWPVTTRATGPGREGGEPPVRSPRPAGNRPPGRRRRSRSPARPPRPATSDHRRPTGSSEGRKQRQPPRIPGDAQGAPEHLAQGVRLARAGRLPGGDADWAARRSRRHRRREQPLERPTGRRPEFRLPRAAFGQRTRPAAPRRARPRRARGGRTPARTRRRRRRARPDRSRRRRSRAPNDRPPPGRAPASAMAASALVAGRRGEARQTAAGGRRRSASGSASDGISRPRRSAEPTNGAAAQDLQVAAAPEMDPRGARLGGEPRDPLAAVGARRAKVRRQKSHAPTQDSALIRISTLL